MEKIIQIKNRRIIKVGASYYMNIPATYLKDGLVDINDYYTINLENQMSK